MADPGKPDELVQRVLDWQHNAQHVVCDVVEPWAHGTVVRAVAYPDYWDYNLVRVEQPLELSTEELRAFTDAVLEGLEHRRVDFDDASVAERYRPELESIGWYTTKLVWMRHGGEVPAGAPPAIEVEEVPYDEAHELRVAWHVEDFPEVNPGEYHRQAREVALAKGARVLVSREGDEVVSFAQLERADGSAEITQVYVHPDHRGGGRGTAMTRAAIEAASDADDLWICADADDRARHLYAKLGFELITETVELTKRP
jgi:ribosomal protein S18 acetylase RimI-like enzyme